MKSFKRIIILFVSIFLLIALAANLILIVCKNQSDNEKNLVMNRIWQEYKSDPGMLLSLEAIQTQYKDVVKKSSLPQSIVFYSVDQLELNALHNSNENLQTYIFPVMDVQNEARGFLIFEYKNNSYKKLLAITNLVLLAVIIFILCCALYIYKNIIKPFEELSQYPERLSRGQKIQNLTESKNKFFGKYIWGMNMLNDVLENERKKNLKLIKDKLVLTSAFAHGIKTPVTNIKLYSNAIQSGLYTQNENDKTVEIADKIEKNADDIQKLVTSLLDTNTKSIFEFEPQISSFYLEEIKEVIIKEFDNTLKMKKIPYQIIMAENPILTSDKNAVIKILFQLLDNAIKYGDGSGINIKLERQSDGIYFSIKNKGSTIQQKEIPYIFNSFWRGSNAAKTEGQGIGLYEAKLTAKKLCGDLFVNITENEFEIVLMLPEIFEEAK
ncbi:MAG: HAMP domain-containing histidine kinase [Treponema sp.]|nr:HAMP domain-containing histidine kinase [Treponema sp.]